MDITTPSLLFSAISLLLSAYNGKYLTLSRRIREFHARQKQKGRRGYKKQEQIKLFRKRLDLIKKMQFFAVASLFLSTLSIFMMLFKMLKFGEVTFAMALISFLISLYFTIQDILCSSEHLKIIEV